MAKEGQTIRVCGLPTDINEKKLSDKLYIHFLRKRNGGGGISSVIVPKTTPGSALITFEDSEVAQRVITHGNHTLSVNDKQYAMTVSLHQKEIDPDELFVDIAVTVDYNKLPGGKGGLSDIRNKFPNVKFDFDPHDNLCLFRGRYSEVQTLTKSLLSRINSNNAQDIQFPKSEVTSDQKMRCHSSNGQVKSQRESSGQACGQDLSKHSSSSSERSRSPSRTSYTNYSDVSGALEEKPSLEDFSMIIDTDIFRYLQHCSVEYQSILERHRVEILDVTTKDITTLFLQVQAEVVAGGMESIERAYVELGLLYQEKEAQLRKVFLPKESLHIQQLQQAIEVLTQTFPKLLINEDKANVYLVGSGSSVSEAKQFLMDMGTTTDESSQYKNKPSIMFQPSVASSLSRLPDEYSNTGGAEGIKMPKLATTFGSDASFNKSIIDHDFSFSSLGEVKMPESDQMYSSWSMGPKVNDGHRFDSGLTSDLMSFEVQPPVSSSRPKDLKGPEDTLSNMNKPLSTVSTKSPSPPSFALSNPNRIKNATNFCASQNYSLYYTPPLSINKAAPTDSVKHSQSGSILRNTSSFSGCIRVKQDGRASTSDVDTVNSLNNSETKEVFSDVVTLPTAQWVYIKEKYCTQIENLTTDLQIRESGTGAGKEVILHLKGADAANGRKTHQGLKELVAKVAKDFLIEELPLVHLGMSDLKKDVVEALCNVVREKFEKVHISLTPKCIFFFGPEVDTQNALHALKELLHFGTKGEMAAKERPCDLWIPSSTPPGNYGLYSSATNLVCDDKTTMDQTTSAANNSVPKDSFGHILYDYPQHTKAEQRDRESVPEHREEDILMKYLNLTKKIHDAQPSFEGTGPSDAHKAPVSKLRLAPAECVELKGFITRTPGVDPSLGVKEIKCSTLSSDIGSQLLTRPKSETSKPLRTNDLWSQTNDVDRQSTINQMRVFNEQKLDEALPKENTTRYFEDAARGESASNILGRCPWCQRKVHPYCSMCPRSETLAPQSSNEEHSGGNQPKEHDLLCECGTRVESVTACGVTLCPQCEEKVHSNCSVCPKSVEMVSGIRGTMACTEMSFSLSGHSKNTTLKLTYDIPDGIQGTDHPNPGAPFQGGKFHAFLPMNDITRKLVPSLEQAFSKGITFSVKALDTGDVVTWGRSIPHKTSIEGGISRNGFPDAGYLKRLAAALNSQGVEES